MPCKAGLETSRGCACAKCPRVAYALKRVDERVQKREKHLYRISNKKCDRERRHRNALGEVIEQTDHGPGDERDNQARAIGVGWLVGLGAGLCGHVA